MDLPREAPNLSKLFGKDLLVRVVILQLLQQVLGGPAVKLLGKLHNVLNVVSVRPKGEKFHRQQVAGSGYQHAKPQLAFRRVGPEKSEMIVLAKTTRALLVQPVRWKPCLGPRFADHCLRATVPSTFQELHE